MVNDDIVMYATVVVAAATVVNVLVAFFQWKAARASARIATQVFESANRPYVGLENFKITQNSQQVRVVATFKNFGTAPAEDCTCRWDAFLSGVLQPATNLDTVPNATTLFPQLVTHLIGDLSRQTYDGIATRKISFEIITTVSYKWGSDRACTNKEKHLYSPENGAFMNLGSVS